MELTAGRLGCIVLVFLLGYYFGRHDRRVAAAARPRRARPARKRRDPADWWMDGGEPPH